MKADKDDAPSYLDDTVISEFKKWAIPAVLGTAMCFGLLVFFSSLATEAKVLPSPKPQVAVSTYRPGAAQTKNPTPQEVAEQQRRWAESEAMFERRIHESLHAYDTPSEPHPEEPKGKQTVFNDRNYIPMGAINSVGRLADELQFQERENEGIRVQGIKEKTRLKDTACGDSGSISARNCRQHIGLEYRR